MEERENALKAKPYLKRSALGRGLVKEAGRVEPTQEEDWSAETTSNNCVDSAAASGSAAFAVIQTQIIQDRFVNACNWLEAEPSQRGRSEDWPLVERDGLKQYLNNQQNNASGGLCSLFGNGKTQVMQDSIVDGYELAENVSHNSSNKVWGFNDALSPNSRNNFMESSKPTGSVASTNSTSVERPTSRVPTIVASRASSVVGE